MNSNQNSPQENRTLNNTLHHMGSFQKSYVPRVLPGRVMFGSAIFCLLMCAVEFITGVNKYLSPPSTILSDRFRQDAILIAFILAAVFFILTLLLAGLIYSHKKHRVDLYAHGIVIFTWRGSSSFRWSEISDLKVEPIYGRSRTPVNWNVTVIRDDRVKAKFRGLQNLGQLIKLVERKASFEGD